MNHKIEPPFQVGDKVIITNGLNWHGKVATIVKIKPENLVMPFLYSLQLSEEIEVSHGFKDWEFKIATKLEQIL